MPSKQKNKSTIKKASSRTESEKKECKYIKYKYKCINSFNKNEGKNKK